MDSCESTYCDLPSGHDGDHNDKLEIHKCWPGYIDGKRVECVNPFHREIDVPAPPREEKCVECDHRYLGIPLCSEPFCKCRCQFDNWVADGRPQPFTDWLYKGMDRTPAPPRECLHRVWTTSDPPRCSECGYAPPREVPAFATRMVDTTGVVPKPPSADASAWNAHMDDPSRCDDPACKRNHIAGEGLDRLRREQPSADAAEEIVRAGRKRGARKARSVWICPSCGETNPKGGFHRWSDRWDCQESDWMEFREVIEKKKGK